MDTVQSLRQRAAGRRQPAVDAATVGDRCRVTTSPSSRRSRTSSTCRSTTHSSSTARGGLRVSAVVLVPAADLRLSVSWAADHRRHRVRHGAWPISAQPLGLGAPGLAWASRQHQRHQQPLLEPPGASAASAGRSMAASACAPPGRRLSRRGDARSLHDGRSQCVRSRQDFRGYELAPSAPNVIRPRPGMVLPAPNGVQPSPGVARQHPMCGCRCPRQRVRHCALPRPRSTPGFRASKSRGTPSAASRAGNRWARFRSRAAACLRQRPRHTAPSVSVDPSGPPDASRTR